MKKLSVFVLVVSAVIALAGFATQIDMALDVRGVLRAANGGANAVSVATYGATGNGITDDTAAIDRAIQAVRSLGGGKVQFGCGNYYINSEVNTPPSDRALLFEPGLSNVQLEGQGSCSHLFSTQLNKSLVEFINGSNISVRGLRLTAQNGVYVEHDGLSGGSAIKCSSVAHCLIDHVEVDGASAGAIYFTNGTTYSTLSNSYIHGTSSIGFNEDNCSAVSATSCAPDSPPIGNRVIDNTFVDAGLITGYGSITIDDGGDQAGTFISGNVISFTSSTASTNSQLAGVNLNNVLGVVVAGNQVNGSPADCVSATNTFGGTISNTYGYRCGQVGIHYYQSAGVLSYLHLENNTLQFPNNQGVSIDGPAATSSTVGDVSINGTHVEVASASAPGVADAINVVAGTQIKIANTFVNGGGTYTRHAIHLGPTVLSAYVDGVVGHHLTSSLILDESNAATASVGSPLPSFGTLGNRFTVDAPTGNVGIGGTADIYGTFSAHGQSVFTQASTFNGSAGFAGSADFYGSMAAHGTAGFAGTADFYGTSTFHDGLTTSVTSSRLAAAGTSAEVFVPGDDLRSTKLIYGANHANGVFVWWINDDGSASFPSYSGPVSAPSGSCTANGAWVFSQDGHATFCASGAWTTKL